MKPGVFLGLVLLLFVGCEGTISTGVDGEPVDDVTGWVLDPTDTQSVSEGAELYRLYCESCHGPEATGAAAWPSPIQGVEPIHDTVANGRGTMAPVPITDQEIALIQAYLLSFGIQDWSTLNGEEVFQAACASCHGATAEGTALGPMIRFRDGAYFKHVTRNGGRADRFGSPMESYGSDRISDAQLDQMVAWIDAMQNAVGGQALYHQFCANCHGDSTIPERFEAEGPIASVCREGKEDSVSNQSYMPGWSPAQLTDAEIADIQSYMNGN